MASRVVAARRRDMPGIATLGKLFFRKFLTDLAGASRASTVSFTAGGAETLSAPREAGGKGASLVSLRPRLRLASHVLVLRKIIRRRWLRRHQELVTRFRDKIAVPPTR